MRSSRLTAASASAGRSHTPLDRPFPAWLPGLALNTPETISHLLFGALHIHERWKMASVCVHWEREKQRMVSSTKNSHWQPHWLSTYRHADWTQQRNKHWANVHFVICAKCVCVCVFVLIYCLKASQHKQIITCIPLIALKSEQEKNYLNFQQTDTFKRQI